MLQLPERTLFACDTQRFGIVGFGPVLTSSRFPFSILSLCSPRTRENVRKAHDRSNSLPGEHFFLAIPVLRFFLLSATGSCGFGKTSLTATNLEFTSVTKGLVPHKELVRTTWCYPRRGRRQIRKYTWVFLYLSISLCIYVSATGRVFANLPTYLQPTTSTVVIRQIKHNKRRRIKR